MASIYPVRVEASLDTHLSRWLWLVKWLLTIPHVILLTFLWIAYFVLSVVAFFAILFTGRYPRAIFDFNVGVLRWSWRWAYYTYGALGTDRYPPFTLAEVPDYPAHLEIDYPEHLSRGLVLVKWWLLAIPHYLVIGLFLGGGTWAVWEADGGRWGGAGLIGILVLIAAVVLAVTGSYPRPIYDFVLGMNRWVLRVAAYAGLMTDRYPPFRLDLGEHEPGATLTLPPHGGPDDGGAGGGAAGGGAAGGGAAGGGGGPGAVGFAGAPGSEVAGEAPGGAAEPPPRRQGPWTAGRIVAVVLGAILGLTSAGFLFGGGAVLWADRTQREGGFLTSGTTTYSTGGSALATDRITLENAGPNWPRGLLGDVRVRVTPSDTSRPVFVGIAPADAVSTYLSAAQYTILNDFGGNRTRRTEHPGGAVTTPPGQAGIWSASASGAGTQTVVWKPQSGDWTIVAMNPDGSAGLTVRADIGAKVPALPWVATALLALGVVMLVAGILLITIPLVRVSRANAPAAA